jgi:hypothetical protein
MRPDGCRRGLKLKPVSAPMQRTDPASAAGGRSAREAVFLQRADRLKRWPGPAARRLFPIVGSPSRTCQNAPDRLQNDKHSVNFAFLKQPHEGKAEFL